MRMYAASRMSWKNSWMTVTDDDDEDDDDYEEFDEEEYASVTCPHCGKDFYFEPAMYEDDEDLLCPHCGKDFKIPE